MRSIVCRRCEDGLSGAIRRVALGSWTGGAFSAIGFEKGRNAGESSSSSSLVLREGLCVEKRPNRLNPAPRLPLTSTSESDEDELEVLSSAVGDLGDCGTSCWIFLVVEGLEP